MAGALVAIRGGDGGLNRPRIGIFGTSAGAAGIPAAAKEQMPRADVSWTRDVKRRTNMGRGLLLWMLGIPLPIVILILLFWH